MEKSIVLLSGGMDSTVNLYAARAHTEVKLALTFNYGQRAFERELRSAKALSEALGVLHRVVDLSFIKDFGGSSLTDNRKDVPTGQRVSIDDMSKSRETAKAVWVPNRNGIFLNVAAGFAESLEVDWIIPGFNIEEASTFPDNSEEFMKSANQSLFYSTSNHVEVRCFTSGLNKTQIVDLGKSLSVDWSLIWPCYFDGASDGKWCGQCESCQRSMRALKAGDIDYTTFFR
jgi:7-cyano-7-deazaguanine synthase